MKSRSSITEEADGQGMSVLSSSIFSAAYHTIISVSGLPRGQSRDNHTIHI